MARWPLPLMLEQGGAATTRSCKPSPFTSPSAMELPKQDCRSDSGASNVQSGVSDRKGPGSSGSGGGWGQPSNTPAHAREMITRLSLMIEAPLGTAAWEQRINEALHIGPFRFASLTQVRTCLTIR